MMEQSLKKLIPKHQNSKGKIKSLKELRQEVADPEYASRISALALEEETAKNELELASTRKQIKREGLEATITAVNSDPKNDPDAERNQYHGDTRDYTYRKSYQHADLAPGDEVKISDVEASWNHPDQADPLALFYVEGVALSPLFKLAGRAGEFALGRMGNLWARNRIIGREFLNQSNRLQLPVLEKLNPIIRTRLGDVEIDNPLLAYRLGNDIGRTYVKYKDVDNSVAQQLIEDNMEQLLSSKQGRLYIPQEPILDKAISNGTFNPYGYLLPHSIISQETPMYAKGFLWYGHPELGEKLYAGDLRKGLLVTPETDKMIIGSSKATPYRKTGSGIITKKNPETGTTVTSVTDNGGRLIPADEDNLGLNLDKISAYTWEPNYGYRKVTPAEGRTSLKMFERPTKTSLSERLGIPRGDRGNLNLDQVEALADLDLYLTSGQYRSTLRLTADDMEPYWGTLRSSDPAFVKVMHDMNILPRSGRYRVSYSSDTGRGTINYNLDTNMAGYSASANFPEVEGFRLGEANMYSDGPFQHNMILTSPRVDGEFTIDDLLSSNDPADVAKGQILDKLPRVIDKNIMRDFWITNGKLQRPGSYATGDAGKFPLGHDLITLAADAKPRNMELQNTLLYGQRPLSKLTISRRGLSPDSFRSIVKLGQREGNNLRWGEGFMSWNDSAIQDKYIYDAWNKYRKHLISEEEYMKIYNDWADQIGARHAQLQITPGRTYMAKNNYGNMEEHTTPEIRRVVIPHPYVYKKKLGGKL